jgi:VIT1/CCC1 family predicted Fe2+/Mn2+ transporter
MLAGNKERHRTGRIGRLRAAVLGANDGILSTSSLGLVSLPHMRLTAAC